MWAATPARIVQSRYRTGRAEVPHACLPLGARKAAWYNRWAGPLSPERAVRFQHDVRLFEVRFPVARRTLNRHELRAAAEAAEGLGLNTPLERKPRAEPVERRPKPSASPRMRVVWAVCDIGGRTVATFDYPCKAEAEAMAVALKAKGKGAHFIRSIKEPMDSDRPAPR
jgi:hypothetical protein